MPQVDLHWVRFKSKADFVTQIYDACITAGLSPASAEIITAQAAHETGWGRRTMNWNLAGVKASKQWRANYRYSVVGTKECIDCKPGEKASPDCPPGQVMRVINGVAWRAYADVVDGVKGILDVLGYRRYKQSKSMLLAGNTNFFRQLGKDGWYTAAQDVYHRSSMHRLEMIKSIRDALLWQNLLLVHDPDCLPKDGADGFWGSEGTAALKQFQANAGLPAHGRRDGKTALVLGVIKAEDVVSVAEAVMTSDAIEEKKFSDSINTAVAAFKKKKSKRKKQSDETADTFDAAEQDEAVMGGGSWSSPSAVEQVDDPEDPPT